MRPISLHVEGFTCFREPQEILDFSELSLFAISGPTGAGKSSILDAMSFALYGHVPRLGKQGVSDVISLGRDRMTARFEFAIGSRRFRVGRELRRRRAASVVLEELTDGTERLLADKVRDADEHIAALTGLRYETFIQTVLLPQGEFARFLHSDPGERGKILRELLKLDVYERMRVAAEQESRQHQQQLKLLRQRLDQDYADATSEHLVAAQRTLDETTSLEAAASAASDTASRHLQDVQGLFALSKELTAKRTRREELQSQRQRIEDERARLERARRAALVLPRLDAHESAVASVAAALRDLETARTETGAAQSNVKEHAAAHEQARQKLAEISALRAKMQALDELRGVIERRGKVTEAIVSTNAGITTATNAYKVAANELEDAKTRASRADRECTEAKSARHLIGYDASRHRALQQVAADAIRGRELHRQLTTARRQATAAANKAAEAEIAAKEAVGTLERQQIAVERAREQLTKAEAGLHEARNAHHAAALRPTLEQGAPCPVCEHVVARLPRKLRAPELEEREHAAEQAKRAETKAARALEDAREMSAGAASQAKERRRVAVERADEIHDIEVALAKASKRVTGVVTVSQRGAVFPPEVFDTISDEADRCEQLRQRFEAAGERVTRAQLALEQSRNRQQQASAALQQHASRVSELRQRLGELEAERSEIDARIAAVTNNPNPAGEREQLAKRVTDLEERERHAQGALQSAKQSLERATAVERATEKALTTRRAEADRLRAEVTAVLAEHGFPDTSAVRVATLSLDHQQRLDASIRAYENESHQVESRILELENTLGGRYVSEHDYREAETSAHDAAQTHRTTVEALARSRQEVKRLERQVERAVALRKEVTDLETRATLIEQLARDLKNDGFQRYLLEEAFQGLVEGASVRMKEWTNRYTLEWDDGAFYALDHDNGAERRRAETLSGGETFLASLSLALQLSEEILRTAGAVQIDSLFLDEGFGTLDAEALETVTDAIESLRTGGRMVGIITHIRDLTERLPGCIEIEKGLGQSRWQLARVG
jgi:exonuclease SbcC